MRRLEFIIEGQRLRKDPSCDFAGIIPGTRHYLETHFTFNEDWDKCVCIAEFSNESGDTDAVLIEDGKCEIPDIVLDDVNFTLKVIGKRKDGYFITTNQIKITQGG